MSLPLDEHNSSYDEEDDDDYEPSENGGDEDDIEHEGQSGSDDDEEGHLNNGGTTTTGSDERKPVLPENVDEIWADFLDEVGESGDKTAVTEAAAVCSTSSDGDQREMSLETKPSVSTEVAEPNVDDSLASDETKAIPVEDLNSRDRIVPKRSVAQLAASTFKPTKRNAPGGSIGGLSAFVAAKKTKLTTLEKSKQDWDKFKEAEGITEELQTYNKGKDGYLNKQEFLQRADVRQFEAERDIRDKTRKRQTPH